MSKVVRIVILGSIAAGKTTVVRNLCKVIESAVPVYEPITEWETSGILEDFYQDQKNLAGPFQMYAFSSRLKHLKKAVRENPLKLLVCDADVISDRNVFKAVLKEDGHISDAMDNIYELTFENWEELMDTDFDTYYIYLHTPALDCLQHKIQRGRKEEADAVKFTYLNKLETKFDKLYAKLVAEKKQVAKVDGQCSKREVIRSILDQFVQWEVIPRCDIDEIVSTITEEEEKKEIGAPDEEVTEPISSMPTLVLDLERTIEALILHSDAELQEQRLAKLAQIVM